MTLTECLLCQAAQPPQASCLHQTLIFHSQWGNSPASEPSTPICSPEHLFLRIWGPAQQPLSSAWIPAKGGALQASVIQTRKAIHLSRLGKLSASCSFCKSPSLSFPSHPLDFLLSTYYSLKLPCTLVYFFSVVRLPWAQGPFCPALCTHPMPRMVCGPERCSVNMCWMEIRKEGGEGRGTTSSNGEDSHAPRV